MYCKALTLKFSGYPKLILKTCGIPSTSGNCESVIYNHRAEEIATLECNQDLTLEAAIATINGVDTQLAPGDTFSHDDSPFADVTVFRTLGDDSLSLLYTLESGESETIAKMPILNINDQIIGYASATDQIKVFSNLHSVSNDPGLTNVYLFEPNIVLGVRDLVWLGNTPTPISVVSQDDTDQTIEFTGGYGGAASSDVVYTEEIFNPYGTYEATWTHADAPGGADYVFFCIEDDNLTGQGFNGNKNVFYIRNSTTLRYYTSLPGDFDNLGTIAFGDLVKYRYNGLSGTIEIFINNVLIHTENLIFTSSGEVIGKIIFFNYGRLENFAWNTIS